MLYVLGGYDEEGIVRQARDLKKTWRGVFKDTGVVVLCADVRFDGGAEGETHVTYPDGNRYLGMYSGISANGWGTFYYKDFGKYVG